MTSIRTRLTGPVAGVLFVALSVVSGLLILVWMLVVSVAMWLAPAVPAVE